MLIKRLTRPTLRRAKDVRLVTDPSRYAFGGMRHISVDEAVTLFASGDYEANKIECGSINIDTLAIRATGYRVELRKKQ